jgi:hypothetical protein
VEVREQRVCAPELEAGRDEELGAAGERPSARERLEHAHRRRPDCDDARRVPDSLPRRGRDGVALAVHRMLLQSLLADGTERVETDVQGDPLDVESREQVLREVEPCRRRGGRARLVRVHRLVPGGIAQRLRDVRRQRRLPRRLAGEP